MNDRGTGQSCPKRRRDHAAKAPRGMVRQAPRRVSTAVLGNRADCRVPSRPMPIWSMHVDFEMR